MVLITADASHRQIDDLWQRAKAYETLLMDFVSKVDSDGQQAIQNALNQVRFHHKDANIVTDLVLVP